MVTKILIPSILILVILFLLHRKKENFKVKVKETINLEFSSLDSIFLISDNINLIEQSEKGTKVFKSNKLIYSNKQIFSDSGEFTGFMFSVKLNNKLKIGFSNLESDPVDEISYGFNILDNGVFEIIEKVENTDSYSVQDIDYCLSGELDECLKSKNKYKFNPNNSFLCIMLNNNKANYLLIKRNEEGVYGSMLIHRGKMPINPPLRLKVIAKDEEVLLPTLLWTQHNFNYNTPIYWSVETSFKDDYDNKEFKIVPMPSITEEVSEISPAPTKSVKEEIDFSKYFGPGKRGIIIQNINVDGEFYQVNYEHNLDNMYLRVNKNRIFLKIYMDDDTYIFRKYPDLKSIEIIRNKQKIYGIELVIGDIISNKYILNKSDGKKIDDTLKMEQSNSPSPF